MGWLVALIAVVIFVWLLIIYPRFRIAVVLIVAALTAIIFYSMKSDEDRLAKSHSLISPSQLTFSDVTLRYNTFGWTVAGTIKNNSSHKLTGLTLKVTVRDCPDASSCVVIGEENTDIYAPIPSSQLRTFNGELFFNNMPTPKKLEWNYQIIQTSGE